MMSYVISKYQQSCKHSNILLKKDVGSMHVPFEMVACICGIMPEAGRTIGSLSGKITGQAKLEIIVLMMMAKLKKWTLKNT